MDMDESSLSGSGSAPIEVPESGLRSNCRPRSTKRRKIRLACEACRARKARCNGAKPQCGNCVQRLERCLYRVSHTQLAEANDYIESLVGRISELEGVIQDLHCAAPTPTTSISQPQVRNAQNDSPALTRSDPISNALAQQRRQLTPMGVLQPPLAQSRPSRVADASSPVDGMGGTAIIGDSSHESDKFYGSSSATSFMKQLFGMIPPAEQPSYTTAMNNEGVVYESQRACYQGHGDFTLLPRALSDHLVNTYWDKVYHLYPFLHKTTFMATYEQLWLPSSQCRIPQQPGLGLGGSERSGIRSFIFHCALNAVMVLGLQFSPSPPDERMALTETLVVKARSHFALDMFDEGSIEVVQTLLLLVQIFQFTTFPTRCWSTIGAACRLAQGLGLHIPSNRATGCLQRDEVELRNKIWHSCLMLDMVVSMTLGRPAVLAYRTGFPLPSSVIPNACVDSVGNRGPPPISELSFFVEAVKLYKTLSNVLSEIYGQNEGYRLESSSEGYGSFDRLVDLDKELLNFKMQLPEPLQWWNGTEQTHGLPFLAQQRNVLHARYLHLQILLYRPTFTQFCRAHCCNNQSSVAQDLAQGLPEMSPADSFAHSTSIRCIRRAVDLVMVTYNFAATEATGAWWYNMYYARTAAMVIFMAMGCPLLRDAVGLTTLHSAWNHCRSILLDKLPQGLTVRNCLQTLEHLHDHILNFMEKHTEGHAAELSNDANNMTTARIPNGASGNAEFGHADNYWEGLFDQSAFNVNMDDFEPFLL